MKRIVLTGGGTAGHVTPNIALLPRLHELGYDVQYIGSYDGIEKKLIEDVLKVPAGTITEDTMIEDVEQWDSLAHVMIIGQLEEELGVSIPLDEAIELKGMRELLEKAGCE